MKGTGSQPEFLLKLLVCSFQDFRNAQEQTVHHMWLLSRPSSQSQKFSPLRTVLAPKTVAVMMPNCPQKE